MKAFIIFVAFLSSLAAFAQTTTRLQPWPDATVVADEWQAFNVPEKTLVWYGRDDRWVTRSVSGAAICNNDFFQIDPIVGVAKVCAVEYPPIYKSPGGLTFLSVRPTGGASCSFAPKGTGTTPVVEFNTAGVSIGWWCTGPAVDGVNPTPQLHLYAIRWSAVTMNWLFTLASAAMTEDLTKRINEISSAATDGIDQLYDVWGTAETRLLASRP